MSTVQWEEPCKICGRTQVLDWDLRTGELVILMARAGCAHELPQERVEACRIMCLGR
jgi:hypothetical protein